MDDDDIVIVKYKDKVEQEAKIEALQKRIEEMEKDRQERNREEASSSSRDVWETILQLGVSNALQKQRAEPSERTLEEALQDIRNIMESTETDRFDQVGKRLEEIVARLNKKGADNVQKGMDELKTTKVNLLETMTTLDDKMKGGNETILIIGGESVGEDLMIGGERIGEDLDEMAILDRKTSTWKVLDLKLPCKNSDGGAVYSNDAIYIFGGDSLKKKLYKLDSQQMKWIKLAEMNEERRAINTSSLVFQGCIWVFGGWNGFAGYLETVEKYCPERNKWIKMPGMSQKRSSAAAAICNEKIFVSGGNASWITLKSVECFDPTSGIWTPMVDMPGNRVGHSMISVGSSLFVMGGFDRQSYFKTVWRILPSEVNAIWEELKQMNWSRRLFTAKSVCSSSCDYQKEIYAIGGWDNDIYLDSVEIFDGERWREGPKLPYGCHSMPSVVIPSSLAERLL